MVDLYVPIYTISLILQTFIQMRDLKIIKKITKRDEGELQRYLDEINKIPQNSDEEDIRLGTQIKSIIDNFRIPDGNFFGEKRDENTPEKKLSEKIKNLISQNDETSRLFIRLRDKLARGHLRFVVSVAKQYEDNWLSLLDLINEWNQGLLNAASRYDPTKWFKFISYAVSRIRQSIMVALSNTGSPIRIPDKKRLNLNNAEKIADLFEQEHGYKPSIEQLAHMTGLEKGTLSRMNKKISSLDAPIGWKEWDDACMLDTLQEITRPNFIWFENETRSEYKEIILTALQNAWLSELQLDVLICYYWINSESDETLYWTKDRVCKKYDIKREEMRKIKDSAIKKLQENKFVLGILRWDEWQGTKLGNGSATGSNTKVIQPTSIKIVNNSTVDELSTKLIRFLDEYQSNRKQQIRNELWRKNMKYYNMLIEVLSTIEKNNRNYPIDIAISRANALKNNRVSKDNKAAVKQTKAALALVFKNSGIT